MDRKKLIKPPVYKWQELTPDIQNHFIIRAIGTGIALIAGIFFGFMVKDLQMILFYYLIVALYMAWAGHAYLCAIYDKIYIYEGVCEKKHLNKTTFNSMVMKRPSLTIYGKCNATMVVEHTTEDGETEVAKFIVPIGYGYDIEESNVLRVYTFENSVIPKNENTFIITNPLIVKVAKN